MKPNTASSLCTYAAMLMLALLACLPSQASAQSCWVNGAANLNFGTVTTGSHTDAHTDLNYQCQASWLLNTYFRVCLFVDEGNPSGLAPRRMTNYNGAFMNYDLYSDAARTRLIGPLGSSYPLYSATLLVPGATAPSNNLRIYGRVPAGQSLPATYSYQGFPSGSVLRYSYNFLRVPTEAECQSGTGPALGGGGQVSVGWSGVHANYANTCRVVVATDLDFGSTGGLSGDRYQTSTIQLQCPTGAAWRVGLDDGANANGSTRRMASGANHIIYELYRDNARTQRWGTQGISDASGAGDNTVQSLTVYGRVPAQPNPPPGTYSDTVTVTLTY